MPEITNLERTALFGLPSLSRLVYVLGLKPNVARDGIVEDVTIQSLREEMFVEPHQGVRNSGSPSPEAIRDALQHLEAKGLLEKLDEHPQRVIVRLLLHSQSE
ncbi:hypothetical protein [Aquipseudomonas alcaligenes]|uniref:Uncharacterized protein n=1 Tax=Aquipseudomonas alcaligenes TaxID=43263 RepID=A0AA37CI46_AQUAC|nr:hypothetical protein [Pseudomonas alcaligenes]BCR26234.1 hypothetical protein KAM426_37610 [Pseudomonas alcaligenes]GIZ68778.1 hypothetical protein KAM428_38630 [Pseudomonas alcaligenes]GIZ73162.1 hypothetical protein KAM429_39230 [Pseudomonas alcaligenes]GIZ77521.1 hypothetical protein KAM430_39300 [Pseudomonas alcaligenes]GIZ81830.1 hypothetical protein KAM432_38780 [Pseudomonas alcaligenes]